MTSVAIIGAGELGASAAHELARHDRVSRVRLIDTPAQVAAGKALDLQQAGAIEGFHTRLEGTDDTSAVTGCDLCIIADRAGAALGEWRGDEGFAMLQRIAGYAGNAPIVFAGTAQNELVVRAVRELRLPRDRVVGSSPEAFASAVISMVALEAGCAPPEVNLTVLGVPPKGFVVPWSEASIGGYALDRTLSQVQLSRIEARAARLWPPGAYALGAAAARVADAMLQSSRRSVCVLTLLGGEFGVKNRPGTLPARLSPQGIVQIRVPALNSRERVQLESALGA